MTVGTCHVRIALLTVMALGAIPDWGWSQQPTLRFSQQASRQSVHGSHLRSAGNETDPADVVGSGVGGVQQVAHQAPVHARGRTAMPPLRAGEQIVIAEGDWEVQPSMHGHVHGDCASCGGPATHGRIYGGDPTCGACGPDCALPCPRLDTLEVFAGAHGFTGPVNRGSGSFGFHEGLNAGMPFICGFAFQGGFQATQSNFEGSFFTPDDRTQSFVTVGAFRRVDLGLQGGLVVDYLSDQWDCDIELAQLRGELSWRMPCEHEFGFWFSAGIDDGTISARDVQFPVPGAGDDTIVITDGTFAVEPLDIYAFFYRKQFACGGEGRAWGGFTDDSRGLLGGNIRLPVSTCLSFSTDFLYVIPREASQTGFAEEAWNVSFNLVWTPCRRDACGPNYCRPLFDVANNGSFVVRSEAQ